MATKRSSQLDLHLTQVLERIGEVSLALRRKQATQVENSPLQLRILGFINDHGNDQIGVARLADELQVSKPTISESVKTLVDRKQLSRLADKTDARAHNLKVTAIGKRDLVNRSPLDRVVAGLSEQRKEAMMIGLLGVLEGLFNAGDIYVQRMCWTCIHYHGDKRSKHRCELLEKTMKVAELRTDCGEHTLAKPLRPIHKAQQSVS